MNHKSQGGATEKVLRTTALDSVLVTYQLCERVLQRWAQITL